MSNRSGEAPGPLATYLEGFAAELAALGYSRSAAARNVQLAAHLSRWLDSHGVDVVGVASEGVAPFFAARREAGYAKLLTTKSLGPLTKYLRGLGVLGEALPVAPTDPAAVLVERFAVFLVCERGLVAGTVRFYVRVARSFLTERVAPDGLDLAGLGAADVTGFTTRACGHLGLSASRQTVSALRSFLRFL